MSIPALRQPKTQLSQLRKSQNDEQFLILTLTNSTKLVVTSDSFHGVINVGDMFKCVVCKIGISNEVALKEAHKTSAEHRRLLKIYPYLEELVENLIRQIDNKNCYCTICRIVTGVQYVKRHVQSDEHKQELEMAILRAETYKPCELNVNIDKNNNK